jgi:hypothetical protein
MILDMAFTLKGEDGWERGRGEDVDFLKRWGPDGLSSW